MNSLQNFDYNGQLIQRRADGFVNLTQMCQANGKRLKDFLDSKPALSTIFVLYSTQHGQIVHPIEFVDGETWGHFELAAELAYQSHAKFHVWFVRAFYNLENPFKSDINMEDFKKWELENFPWQNDPSNDKEKQGTVYFVLNQTRNLLKVGFTGSDNCESRLSAFKSGAVGESFLVLGEVAGTLKTEAMYHSYLAEHKVKGEWFKYNDKVKDFLASIVFKDSNGDC
jgi:hypothetical protein